MSEEERKALAKEGILNVPACELPHYDKRPAGDFRSSFHWRVFRIMSEFVEGFQFLADFKKTVTFFGSARAKEGDQWYEEARKLSNLLGDEDFSVVTGGGPGIMEAGNRGIFENKKSKGKSIGINIQLPYEQRINPYVERGRGFYYFFSRKVMLTYAAQAYVYFPGGFGTLDEFFELITLIQTKKIPEQIPIILIGSEFWGGLIEWMKKEVLEHHKAISPEDMNIFKVVNTAEEAFEIIKNSPERHEF